MKLLIIGLDGATLDIIEPLVKAGKLPTFASFMKEGAWGKLKSTVLPVSPPAWTSFMTGKNPGKHGVFGFFVNLSNQYKTRLVTALDIKARPFWEYFDKDIKIGLIEVPMTYPPKPINGVMISGMIVPSHFKTFTYPASLHTELIMELGDYPIDRWLQEYIQKADPIEGLKALYYYTSFRQKAALYLIEKKGPFDFFMVVFRGTDFIQHYAFKFLDKDYVSRHPEEGEKFGEVIFQFYEKIDSYIAELMRKVDENCTVIIMSDHGGGPLKKYFYINSWLIKEGYLKLKKEAKKRQIKLRKRPIERVFKRFHLEHLLPASLRRAKLPLPCVVEYPPEELVDWENTKAYANLVWTDGVIRINLKGREPYGCVNEKEYELFKDEIKEKLLSLVDPETGKPFIEAVYKREEIYHGPYVKDAPDLLIITKDIEYAFKIDLIEDKFLETPTNPSPATHRMDGIFFMKGPAVCKGKKIEGLNIMDIAPTILYLMGYSIPKDMDGKVIKEAIEEDYLKRCPTIFFKEKEEKETVSVSAFSKEEVSEIEKQLKSLGYME